MFIDHTPNRPVRHLKWRLRLLGVGAVFAVVGIFLDDRRLVWIAIAFLTVGVLIRLLPGEPSGSDSEDRSHPEERPPSDG